MINNGCRGVGPNGSLGEYSSLTDAERRKVVQVAVETVAGRGLVVAGVHGVGWHQAEQWAEYAKEDGADGVLLLPPTIYRANRREIIEHYTRVNEVGLPIMLYNNPFDTKVDLTPDLVAELYQLENVVAVKEFSADIRRVLEIKELCDIDVIAGADDLLFESLVVGATGWFAGYPNAFPKEAVEIYDLVQAGKIADARELYEQLVAVFRWDSRTEFVQAIKLVDRHRRPELRRPDPPAARTAQPRAGGHRRAGHPQGTGLRRRVGVEDSPVRSSPSDHRRRLAHRGDADPRRHRRRGHHPGRHHERAAAALHGAP